MRVLVTVNDALGHVFPLASLLQALVADGHEVLVACPGPAAARLDLPGVEQRIFDPGEFHRPEFPGPGGRDDRLRFAITHGWPSHARGWARELVEAAGRWGPDLVIAEPVEHAGRVAAAALGVPWVEHGWGFGLPTELGQQASTLLTDLYAEFGATPRPPQLRLDLGPVRLQPEDVSPDVVRYRFTPWAPPASALPAPGARPRVLVTVGTMHTEAESWLATVAGAVTATGAEPVVATGGRGFADVPWPPGTLAVDWLHLPSEVARCAAVVHHGGAGSAYATVDAGVPAVCLPQFADQFRNARTLAAAGACLTLEANPGPRELQDLIAHVLGNQAIREGAERLRAENQAMPGANEIVRRLVGASRTGSQAR